MLISSAHVHVQPQHGVSAPHPCNTISSSYFTDLNCFFRHDTIHTVIVSLTVEHICRMRFPVHLFAITSYVLQKYWFIEFHYPFDHKRTSYSAKVFLLPRLGSQHLTSTFIFVVIISTPLHIIYVFRVIVCSSFQFVPVRL